jgi:hypothetical protein
MNIDQGELIKIRNTQEKLDAKNVESLVASWVKA